MAFLSLLAENYIAKLLHRGCLHKDEESTLAIVALEAATTLDIDIEKDILLLELVFYLRFECTIEATGINLLVFHELIGGYTCTELIRGEEEVIHSMLLGPTWRTACSRNGETE